MKRLNRTLKSHRERIYSSRLAVYTLLFVVVLVRLLWSLYQPSHVYVVSSSGKAVALNSPFKLVYVSSDFYPGDVIKIDSDDTHYINTATLLYSDYRHRFWNSRLDTASKQMSATSSAIMFGMLGGFKVPLMIREKFASYGMAHLFAVSGTHIDVLGAVFYLLGFPMWVVIIVVAVYGFLVGFSPSIIRAIVFLVLLVMAKHVGEKHVDIWSLAILTTLIVMIFVPGYVLTTSYILSLSIALAVLYSFSYKKYDVMLWIIWGLSAWYFSRMSLFTVAFFILSLLFGILMWLSILWLAFPIKMLASVLDFVLKWIASVPVAPFPVDIFVPSYVAFLFLGILFVRLGGRNLKYVGALLIILVVSLYMLLGFVFPYRAVYINVGEGDSILLVSPEARMLVDTGRSYEWVAGNILKAVKQMGVNGVDFILLTHEDKDHTGGYDKYLKNMFAGRYTGVIRGENVCGKTWQISPQFYVIFHPCGVHWTDNEQSAITYFHNQWLMADIEGRGLQWFLSKYAFHADVLKMPHHGAYDKNTSHLVDKVSPRYAIISVGKNPYGHPKPATMNILKGKRVKIYKTDADGSVVVLISRSGNVYFLPLRHWWLYALQYIV